MTYIKQARTPTLIQHGSDDPRVPIPKANRAAMQQNLEWFTRYLWNQPGATHQ